MARSLRDAKLDTREARLRLPVHPKPRWRLIEPGLHLGYRRLAGRPGTWCVRRYVGSQSYTVETLRAVADDYSEPNGKTVLSFRQAQRAVLAGKPKPAAGALTVKDALDQYLQDLTHRGKLSKEVGYRINALIAPALGAVPVEALTSEQVRAWHAALARSPGRHAQKADGAEAQRRRRSSANRTLTVLRAALNFAYREGRTPSDAAWRRVRPFHNVDAARLRYLSVAEAQRLINAAEPEDFRRLLVAALQTGMRYGELARLRVHDFNADAGTVQVRQSKSGRSRHVVLTDEGTALFRQWCAGRAGTALLFTRGGEPWGKSNQDAPMRAACQRARIEPPIGLHAARHTYASLSIMASVPLLVVARNLGHVDGRMVEKHYGHLAPSFAADAIRRGAPRFGVEPDKKIATLAGGR
jgi:integrase